METKRERAEQLRYEAETERKLHRGGPEAIMLYQQAVASFREVDSPLALAHTVRHLGDVYIEGGRPDLAEPCFQEALALYRGHSETAPLDLANAIRSMALLRDSPELWMEARDIYRSLGIEAGVAESLAHLANSK